MRFALRVTIASTLSFVAGYADLMSVVRFQVFTGMMTGNLIKAGLALALGRFNHMVFALSVIAANMLGTAVYEALELTKNRDPVLTSTVLCFTLYMITPFLNYWGNADRNQAVCVAMAMGIQNAMGSRPSSPIGVITCLMTGAMQKISGLSSKRVLTGPLSAGDKNILVLNVCLVSGTICGVITAGLALVGAVGKDNIKNELIKSSVDQTDLWWTFLPPAFAQLICLVSWRWSHDAKMQALAREAMDAVLAAHEETLLRNTTAGLSVASRGKASDVNEIDLAELQWASATRQTSSA